MNVFIQISHFDSSTKKNGFRHIVDCATAYSEIVISISRSACTMTSTVKSTKLVKQATP